MVLPAIFAKHFPSLRELCRLVLQTENYPFRIFMRTNPDTIRLRSGKRCGGVVKTVRTPPQSISPPKRPTSPPRKPRDGKSTAPPPPKPGAKAPSKPSTTPPITPPKKQQSKEQPKAPSKPSTTPPVTPPKKQQSKEQLEAPATPPKKKPTVPSSNLSKIRKGRISKQWPTDTINYQRPIGFMNPSNFCYRNSILQCLLHLPVFYNAIHALKHNNCSKPADKCVVRALQWLLILYWVDRGQDSLPDGQALADLHAAVKDAVPKNHSFRECVNPGRQGDPMEFFNVLVNELKKAEKAETEESKQMPSLVKLKYVELAKCGLCQSGFEKVIDEEGIQLPVTREDKNGKVVEDKSGQLIKRPLIDWLRDEFQEETVERDFDGCREEYMQQSINLRNIVARRTQRRKLLQVPDLLTIQLMRFNKRGQKLTHDVPFDEELDLTEFAVDGSQIRYRLHGIVGHSGPTIKSGHYAAGVRSQAGTGWHFVNGSTTSPLVKDLKQVVQQIRNIGAQPVVLVYQRVDTEISEPEKAKL